MPNYGGQNNRPMAPVYNPAIATSFFADPANRGKKVSDLWAGMPTFTSWEDAARGDFGGVNNPAFANLTDEGRTNLLRDVYGLSSDYKTENGSIVRAKPHQGLIAGLTLGAMIAPNLLQLAWAGSGGAAGAAGGVLPSAPIPAVAHAAPLTLGSAAPVVTKGATMSLGKILSSPLLSTGVQGAFGAYGAKQQQKGLNAQLQLEQQRDAEARRQWEAQQVMAERQFQAQEEDRRFQRELQEERRRLDQEREGRQAPYRAASQAALGRLGAILGLSR